MKKIKFIILSITTALTALVTVGATYTWFSNKQDIDSSEKLGGKFLSQFFHSGDGSEEAPFEITKPFHYENLIKFQEERPSFAKAGYYFRFGSTDDRMPGEPTTPVFYETDEKGVVNTKKTSKILNLGLEKLPPLGTAELPFIGHIDGSDLTISNFVIAGEGYYDVGVFGYVELNTNLDGSSPIHNCYWRDFKIDTTAVSSLVHKHDIQAHPEHAHYNEDKSVEVGYLAGHTVYSSAFSDCYVNNCTIKSDSHGATSNTSYGYFGMAENDYLGGQTGKGKNYSFELDSEAIYRSTRQVYDNISDNPIRARSGYADYTTPINNDLPEIYTSGGKTITKYPFSGAMSREKARDNNDIYTLEGVTPSKKTAARNYSFSTVGYQPTTTDVEPAEYETYYTRGDSTQKIMASSTVLKDDWKGQPNTSYTKKDGNALTGTGDFLYHDGTSWKYIHAENKANEQMGTKSFNITCSDPGDVTFTGFAALGFYGSCDYAHGYFYVDNKLIHEEDIKSRISIDPSSTRMTVKKVGFKTKTFSVNLTRGLHYFEYYFVVRTRTTTTSSGTSYRYVNCWFSNSNNPVDNTSGGDLTITSGTFNVTQDLWDQSGTRTLPTFDCSDHAHRDKSYSVEAFNLTNDTRAATTADIPQYVSQNTFEATLYGTNTRTKQVIQMNDDTLNWRKDSGTTVGEDGVSVNWHKWIAYNTPSRAIDTTKNPVYLSDNPDITPRITEGTYVKGYEWKNIDIVGGGVSFYYRNFDWLGFDVKVISIPAENSTNYVTNSIPVADINNGATFYSTKYCPCSIVLYFKNTANAADTNDHELGQIDFTYVNASAFGTSVLNLSVPSFKKGSGSFKTLSDFGTISGSGTFDYETTFSGTMKESSTKKCSYCALDADRKILGVFDGDGNPSTGFINADGSLNVNKLLKIDTYVIALGSNSNITNSTWITDISFEYISNEGYGGTFGSIEYRDMGSKVESTILNFFVNVPEGANFTIGVIYYEDSQTIGGKTYSGKNYFITFYSNITLKMNVYLYNSDYKFTFNGTEYSTTLEIGLSSIPPPSS